MSNATLTREPAKLTGGRVLLMLMAFFGAIGSVDAYMIYCAVHTFSGETASHPYEAGLAFNKELAAARAQATRDWRVNVTFDRDGAGQAAHATFADAEGRPLSGLDVSGVFASPSDTKRDKKFVLKETAPGTYVGVAAPAKGLWDFEIAAKRDDATLFQSKNRLQLN